jgi:hypothetical protein
MKIKQEYMNSNKNGGSIIDSVEQTSIRKTLHSLITLKNQIPRHDLSKFDILTTNFQPENNPAYVQGIVYSLALLIWISIVLFVVFVTFIIGRYFLNKCDAVIEKDETYTREQRSSYVLGMWAVGTLLLASVVVTMVGNIGSFQSTIGSVSEITSLSKNLTDDIQ